mgnify:CR=1 FL=1
MEPIRLNPVGSVTTPSIARKADATGGFGEALAQALSYVNQAQNESGETGRRFQLGDPSTSLEDTMISLQKANVSLQAAVQVRNRLVSAYHDIMNMNV